MESNFINYIEKLSRLLDHMNLSKIDELKRMIGASIKYGHQCFIFGNGGSMTTAQHVAEDFTKVVREGIGQRVKFISCASNPGQLTCLANDLGYDNIFKYELETHAEKHTDMAIGLSVSGTSSNVIKALDYAREIDLYTVLLTGNKIKNSPYNLTISVDSMNFGLVENVHLILMHYIIDEIINEEKNKEKIS